MKAELKPRIELANRTKLETVIPLEVPFTIFVDPSDACNFQCKFCPTGNREMLKGINRIPGIMDFDLYKKIVDDICEFPHPIKVLRLYKDGEPLMHPKFPEMIAYAKQKKCSIEVDTTTNASLLTPEKSRQLIDAGLDRINISVEGVSSEQYKQFSGYELDFEKYVENVRYFYENKKNCLVCVKICGDILSEEEKKKFLDTFGNISDRIFIEHIAPCWPNFELTDVKVNNEQGIYGQPIKEVMVCPYIFYSISINSDGKASLCFLDWARKLIVGDARTESIKEIWNGEKLYEYRKLHLEKRRKEHPVCGVCGQLTHCLPDDIDQYSEMLLEKISKAR
ncbi:MAG: radical SAM protein [Fibrobacteres bacterium]|nr:radical SAM protein [Fibrobacterota bacterium]